MTPSVKASELIDIHLTMAQNYQMYFYYWRFSGLYCRLTNWGLNRNELVFIHDEFNCTQINFKTILTTLKWKVLFLSRAAQYFTKEQLRARKFGLSNCYLLPCKVYNIIYSCQQMSNCIYTTETKKEYVQKEEYANLSLCLFCIIDCSVAQEK